MSEDSYEQHVAKLVKGKRDLFDNVIDPDASEDVIGVSKKMLETLIDDLAAAEPHELADKERIDSESLPEIQADSREPKVRPILEDESEEDDAIKTLIEKIQTGFAGRIERILAKGGGLLVVVDQWQDADELTAQDL